MNTDWKRFWKEHVSNVEPDPFKQVGRTLHGEPMTQEMFETHANRIIDRLQTKSSQVILDLCCGNGLLSTEIAKRGCQVVAVDFSPELIKHIRHPTSGNIIGIVSDVIEIKFKPETFHRVVMAAAIQHFTLPQTVSLFKEIFTWLKPGGKLMITDITDRSKMWHFYNSQPREDQYFQDTLENSSPLGTWHDLLWLEKLARHTGFSSAQTLEQGPEYWYAHYRTDLLCCK